jgi:signal recognition particle receptor subunit beta
VQFDFAAKELTIKLVYYGPALSGKTTNLQSLHRLADSGARGRLMTLETRDDRTLFFDMLPLTFRSAKSMAIRLKLFTVPGQVIHKSTRRLVLQGADGVAFIADSQLAETENNAAAFVDLRDNLKDNGVKLGQLPLVIQFNKRDLPDVRSDAELAELAGRGKEPVFPATATNGAGVLETFMGLLHLTYRALDGQHMLSDKTGISGEALLSEVGR